MVRALVLLFPDTAELKVLHSAILAVGWCTHWLNRIKEQGTEVGNIHCVQSCKIDI